MEKLISKIGENKEEFLASYSESNSVYKKIFRHAKEKEEELGVELYNFSEKQLFDFIKNDLKPKSRISARTFGAGIATYIQWAIDKGISNHDYNVLRRRKGFFDSFVDEKIKLYLSLSEIEVLSSLLYNAQDAFILMSIFNGIYGDKMCELVNMKMQDINIDENTVTVYDKKTDKHKTIKLDRHIITLAKLADKENEYLKRNGDVEQHNIFKETVKLIDNGYILKPSATSGRTGEKKPVSYWTVYNRLEMLRTLQDFEDYQECMKTKYIFRSGMIYYGNKIYRETGVFGRKEIEEVCEKYNVKYTWAMKDFLNIEMFDELYS